MSRFLSLLRGRFALLAVLAVALGSGLGLLPAANACTAVITTYYTTASRNTVVGQRGFDCNCNPVSWGIVTPYHTNSPACP